MNHSQTKAIILRRINFGEADRIITVVTNDHGKLSLLAKGVRRSKSKLAGGLELFSVSDIGFIDGKSDLKTITTTRLIKHYRKITESIQHTMCAYEFIKMVDTFTQHSCDGDYFDLLENALESLETHHEHIDVVQLWFMDQLLKLSGTSINVENQVGGKKFEEGEMYQFSFDDMAFFAHPSGVFEPKHIKFLRLLSKVSRPENLLHVSGARELAGQLKPTLEQCIKMH